MPNLIGWQRERRGSTVVDYEMGPEAVVQLKRAAVAIESAERFVESIAELCSAGGVDNS
jgi:hypothetical protein